MVNRVTKAITHDKLVAKLASVTPTMLDTSDALFNAVADSDKPIINATEPVTVAGNTFLSFQT